MSFLLTFPHFPDDVLFRPLSSYLVPHFFLLLPLCLSGGRETTYSMANMRVWIIILVFCGFVLLISFTKVATVPSSEKTRSMSPEAPIVAHEVVTKSQKTSEAAEGFVVVEKSVSDQELPLTMPPLPLPLRPPQQKQTFSSPPPTPVPTADSAPPPTTMLTTDSTPSPTPVSTNAVTSTTRPPPSPPPKPPAMPPWLYRPQSSLNVTIALFPPDQKQQQQSAATTTHRPAKVAMCFFGLVKNLQDSRAELYVNNIFRPLRDAGYIIDAFMHTYDMANHTYFNNVNGEGNNTVLKQSESIDKLVRLLPELTHIQYSDPREADTTMPELASVLRNGNPWPNNGNVSMFYYLRQLYSIMKVTEMWSNISIVSSPSAEVLFGRGANEADDGKTKPVFQMTPQAMSYDCVMYLRADLRFPLKLNMNALRSICSPQREDIRDTIVKTDLAVPAFEYGGYNDRYAFGTPGGMFLYGARGLMVHRFINRRVGPVHAETYLKQFLCDNSVPVHLVPMYQQRVRAQGHVSDVGVDRQRYNYFKGVVTGWTDWSLFSITTTEIGRKCAPISAWGEAIS